MYVLQHYLLIISCACIYCSGKDAPIRHLYEVVAGQKAVVIGTLFKSMELKPSILKELSEDVSHKYSGSSFIKGS